MNEYVSPQLGIVASHARTAAGKFRRHRRQAQRRHQRRVRIQGDDRARPRACRAQDFLFQPQRSRFRLAWKSKTKSAWCCSIGILSWSTARTVPRSRATASIRCWSWRWRRRPSSGARRFCRICSAITIDAALDAIVPAGQRRVLNWRHNLDSGAQAELLQEGKLRNACVDIAVRRHGDRDTVRIDRRRAGRRRPDKSSKSIPA